MIDPITREEFLLAKALGENVPDIVPVIRKEMYLAKIAGADIQTPEAITREEMYLDAIANGTEVNIEPITRKEMFYAKALGLIENAPEPITRIEGLLNQITVGGGGGSYDKYSWEGVFASIKAGTYATDYAIGDMIPLDLGREGLINMQIAAFDTDDLADGSGKAPITWIAKELLATKHRMNPYISSENKKNAFWTMVNNNGIWSANTNNTTVRPYPDQFITLSLTAKKDIDTTISSESNMNDHCISVCIDDVEVIKDLTGEIFSYDLSFKNGDTKIIRFKRKALVHNPGQAIFEIPGAYSFDINIIEQSYLPQKPYTEGTGVIGGWEKSEMRAYLADTTMPLIPTKVRTVIKQVTKVSGSLNGELNKIDQHTSDYLWIPSYKEVCGSNIIYNELFSDNASRVRKLNGIATPWALRNSYSIKEAEANYFDGYDAVGANTKLVADEQNGVCLCFCT